MAAKSPRMRKITQIAKKIKKRIFAISAAPAAMPPKPNRAAMIEITKKMAAHRSMNVLYARSDKSSISLACDTVSSRMRSGDRMSLDSIDLASGELFVNCAPIGVTEFVIYDETMESKTFMKFVSAIVCLLGLTTCSSHKPILYPNAHLQSVDEETSKQDIAGCRAIAKEAGASTGSGKGGAMAGSTAVGAGAGAASGAVGGAIVGSLGVGAAAGAASGAVFGFLGGLFSPSQPDPAYVSIVNRCLVERGYEVAGWK